MTPRRLLLCLTISVALLIPLPAAGATPLVSADRVADAVRFREELRFDARPQIVETMLTQGQVTAFGLVLSSAEVQELQRRSTTREAMEEALTYVDSHPSDFGGVFFDQSVGDLLLIVNVVSGTSPEIVHGFQSLLPAAATVEYREVQYATNELAAIRQELLPLVPDTIDFIAIDVVSNRVQVAMVEKAPRPVFDSVERCH